MENYEIINVPYIRAYTFVYYLIGATAGIFCSDIVKYLKDRFRVSAIIIIVIFSIAGMLITNGTVGNNLKWFFLSVLVTSFIWILTVIPFKRECPAQWKISFFLFASHPFLIGVMYEIEKRAFPINNISSVVWFFINPFMTVIIVGYVVILLKKLYLYKWLTGEF